MLPDKMRERVGSSRKEKRGGQTEAKVTLVAEGRDRSLGEISLRGVGGRNRSSQSGIQISEGEEKLVGPRRVFGLRVKLP